MNEYKDGKIYLIKFYSNPKLVYIGSTKDELHIRFRNHAYHLCSIHKYIINNFNSDWSNCYIELYENYPCNSQKELDEYETIIIQKFFNDDNYIVINKNKTGGNIKNNILKKVKEFLIKHIKEQLEDNIKNYEYEYESNKPDNINDININKKIKKEKRKDTVNDTEKNKKAREYYNNLNLEKKKEILLKKKIYREKRSETINCECGGYYTFNSQYTHFKSNIHLEYINNK